MTKPIIQTENMSFTYPDGTSALNNINLEILEGEKAAIIGSNGAGKSTLFSHFNGILGLLLGYSNYRRKMPVIKKMTMEIRQKWYGVSKP